MEKKGQKGKGQAIVEGQDGDDFSHLAEAIEQLQIQEMFFKTILLRNNWYTINCICISHII